jgi:hypothetical protein
MRSDVARYLTQVVGNACPATGSKRLTTTVRDTLFPCVSFARSGDASSDGCPSLIGAVRLSQFASVTNARPPHCDPCVFFIGSLTSGSGFRCEEILAARLSWIRWRRRAWRLHNNASTWSNWLPDRGPRRSTAHPSIIASSCRAHRSPGRRRPLSVSLRCRRRPAVRATNLARRGSIARLGQD